MLVTGKTMNCGHFRHVLLMINRYTKLQFYHLLEALIAGVCKCRSVCISPIHCVSVINAVMWIFL